MFRIGEFAQIAQVSGRQLRFYDQLGLLRPAHVDQQTGYRYYTIRQLPRLNSILALKELGLALEQIGPLLEDKISPADLRSMLVLKRAQLERSLHEEEARLRHVESRIAQIDREGTTEGFDVIVEVRSGDAVPVAELHVRQHGRSGPHGAHRGGRGHPANQTGPSRQARRGRAKRPRLREARPRHRLFAEPSVECQPAHRR